MFIKLCSCTVWKKFFSILRCLLLIREKQENKRRDCRLYRRQEIRQSVE